MFSGVIGQQSPRLRMRVRVLEMLSNRQRDRRVIDPGAEVGFRMSIFTNVAKSQSTKGQLGVLP